MASLLAWLKESDRLPAPWTPQSTPLSDPDLERAPDHPAQLLCAACRAFVTDSASRLEKNGAHAHTFVNPIGIVYRVGCFARAPGTSGLGGEIAEFSWFPGFAWQIILCRSCGVHLGWRFRAPDTHFYALILDRIVETRGPERPRG